VRGQLDALPPIGGLAIDVRFLHDGQFRSKSAQKSASGTSANFPEPVSGLVSSESDKRPGTELAEENNANLGQRHKPDGCLRH
jgi:hypothetical protein